MKYYNENESKECIYLDFYEVLNYIHKNRGDKIGHEENQYGTECFAGALRKTIESAKRMIHTDEETSVKYFKEIFAHDNY